MARAGGLVGQAPPPEGNCTLLASWSERAQRACGNGWGPRALAQAAHEGGVAGRGPGRDRIEGILLVGAAPGHQGRPAGQSARHAAPGGAPSQTLSQALAGESRLVCSCLRVSEQRIVDAITRQGVSELAGLQALLGCGSNCGTCLPEIDKLLIKHVFLASA